MSAVVIDPFSSGVHYHHMLQEAGVAYHSVRTQRALESGASEGGAVPHLLLDNASEDQLAELVSFCIDHGVDTIMTGSEPGVPLAEALKAELGLASNAYGDQGRRFWDKPLLYSTLSEHGVRTPERIGVFSAQEVASGHHRRTMDEVALPAVVKPDVGAGSVGVRVVQTPEQGIEAVESIVAAPGFFGGEASAAVVQEYVSGREYVIDTVSHAGHHRVLAVCTYDKHPSSSGSMVYDRLRWLDWDAPEIDALVGYATSVLNALDHREGSVHLEAIIDNRGPCLIDLGARPHGAGHPLKTHLLTGSSQLHAEVAMAAGMGAPTPGGYELRAHAAIEFLSLDQPATIRADADPTEVLQFDFILSGEVPARPGDEYPETHSLLDSLALGLVFVSGRDDDELVDNAEELRRAFGSMLQEADHAH